MKKVLALLLGIIMLMGTLTGFALAETSEETQYLRLAISMANSTKSGFAATFLNGNKIDLRFIWEGLMGYDYVNDVFVNVLADSVELAEDGLTCTVKLKKDAYWHDGKPVVAEDVAFTYRIPHIVFCKSRSLSAAFFMV